MDYCSKKFSSKKNVDDTIVTFFQFRTVNNFVYTCT